MNVETGTEAAVPFLGKHKWDFGCSADSQGKQYVLYAYKCIYIVGKCIPLELRIIRVQQDQYLVSFQRWNS